MPVMLGGLTINRSTGLVNVTPAEAVAAEAETRRRELFNMRFLRADIAIAANPADIALCERMMAAAKDNPADALRMTRAFPEVGALFDRRALFFHP